MRLEGWPSSPTTSESLAGRLAFVELWPLSMAERTGAEADFLTRVFSDRQAMLSDSGWTKDQYLNCVTSGGYPEVLGITSAVARRAWYEGYLHTVISRDIASFAAVAHSGAVARLLGLVAARAGSLAVLTELASAVELARDTTRNYLSYLDIVYLTMHIPAWSNNVNARLTKTGKLYPTGEHDARPQRHGRTAVAARTARRPDDRRDPPAPRHRIGESR